MHVLLEEA